jgi:D-sedoheptulose 7-phosphate isomerase
MTCIKKQTNKIEDVIQKQISESIRTKELLLNDCFIKKVMQASVMLIDTLKKNRKVFLCGNGGSAADCQHWAAEMTGRFLRERKALGFISLTTNTSEITSIGNDYSFKRIFSRQIEGLGKKGDVLICISTSGRSENILAAAATAKKMGLRVISLIGKKPCPLSKKTDIEISVPSVQTPRIQEAHCLIMHILCHLVEDALFIPNSS